MNHTIRRRRPIRVPLPPGMVVGGDAAERQTAGSRTIHQAARFLSTEKPKQYEHVLLRVLRIFDNERLQTVPIILRELCNLWEARTDSTRPYEDLCKISPSARVRILMLANSIYFGPADGHNVRDLSEAVRLIGTERAREVLLRTSVGLVFKSPSRLTSGPAGYSSRALWLNAVATATAARVLHNRIYPSVRPTIDPYMAGLLINLGIAVEEQSFSDGFNDALQFTFRGSTNLERAERNVLGLTHAEVGAAFIAAEKLPAELAEAVYRHHDPHVKSPRIAALIYVLRAAQWLACKEGYGFSDIRVGGHPPVEAANGHINVETATYTDAAQQVRDECAMLDALGWLSIFGR